jgi:hypothetical protein
MKNELQRLAERICKYKAEEYTEADGTLLTTVEEMTEEYNRLKEVSETLTICELRTIWYIRNLMNGRGFNYFSVAKKEYEVFQEFLALSRVRTGTKAEGTEAGTAS